MMDILELLLPEAEPEEEEDFTSLRPVRITATWNPHSPKEVKDGRRQADPSEAPSAYTDTPVRSNHEASTRATPAAAVSYSETNLYPAADPYPAALQPTQATGWFERPVPSGPSFTGTTELTARMAQLQRAVSRSQHRHSDLSAQMSSSGPVYPLPTAGRGRREMANYAVAVDTAFARDARRYDGPVRML